MAFVIKSADAPDDSVLTQQVIEACAGRLASFKVPRAVYYVDEFPTRQLRQALEEPPARYGGCESSHQLTAWSHSIGIGRRPSSLVDAYMPRHRLCAYSRSHGLDQ